MRRAARMGVVFDDDDDDDDDDDELSEVEP